MSKLEDITQNIVGIVKVTAFFGMIMILVPALILCQHLRPETPYTVPRLFHRFLVWLFGFQVNIHGEPTRDSPVLFVANHVSYLDIPVLGSILPASFVAKSEVASWPLFGYLAKLQNTVFIERRSTRAADQRTQLQDHFAKRQNLILFPEGTSSDGLTVLPFKSSLFSIVEDCGDTPITVQPVSVTCTGLDGLPILLEERALYAWYGDMTLTPHLWAAFKRGCFTVDVIFHRPLAATEFPNRKLLAATCQNMVAHGIEQSLRGTNAAAPLVLENA